MQSNPSTDSYADYEDDEQNNDYESEYENQNEDRVVVNDDDDDEDEDEDVENDNEEFEELPEAKGLVQPADDEEDMGYDEDDERIAIAVERPRTQQSNHDDAKGYVNEEGSGSYGRSRYNRFRLDSISNYRHNSQKTSEVDLRESSGNFANDDEDDNDDDVSDEDDTFFNSKITSNNRYFRKNTNDAIKIISTPLGKVGIVYQQSPPQSDEKRQDNIDRKTTLTDFDALSPDPESSHRLASSHPKITPVLTPDGKVALLYRGDSESSKYEPIHNLTHKYNIKGETIDNKTTSNIDTNSDTFSSESRDTDSTYTENEDDSKLETEKFDTAHNKKEQNEADTTSLQIPQFSDVVPTTGSFIIRPTDSVLPMINRPLSEVLGIKKNQFKQIRIKDNPTSTTTTENTPHLLAGSGLDHSDTTTLRFLTKVNLADYPTSTRSRIFDFDFSRDNTMLDERSRQRQQQQKELQMSNAANGKNPINEPKLSTIASDEILSKTEVVNLAIIPHFDEELERLQKLRDEEIRRHHRKRHRHKQNDEELSGIHCIMQAMMGIAAISTVFGMLGTFFKQRILDQIRLMHW